ncbi:unnamed protein product [Pleuronectes platessa]|uniref:Uncharacterized protein n=1 Tax=Pleuronectes platessa TaxID=8262 RepID=A0A9N7V6S0_PLEPL|nr:unnamed protein product [Pleuronectes platessa]
MFPPEISGTANCPFDLHSVLKGLTCSLRVTLSRTVQPQPAGPEPHWVSGLLLLGPWMLTRCNKWLYGILTKQHNLCVDFPGGACSSSSRVRQLCSAAHWRNKTSPSRPVPTLLCSPLLSSLSSPLSPLLLSSSSSSSYPPILLSSLVLTPHCTQVPAQLPAADERHRDLKSKKSSLSSPSSSASRAGSSSLFKCVSVQMDDESGLTAPH